VANPIAGRDALIDDRMVALSVFATRRTHSRSQEPAVRCNASALGVTHEHAAQVGSGARQGSQA
jgi:hypothetical protein